MKLFSPKSKNFLIFSQNKVFLIFQEIEFLDPNIKEFLIFSQKSFSCISGNRTFRKTSYIWGGNFPSLKNKRNSLWKNFSYFGKWNFLAPSLKKSNISRGNFMSSKNKNFLYFSKKGSFRVSGWLLIKLKKKKNLLHSGRNADHDVK